MSIIRRFKYLIVLILIPLTLTIIWFRSGLILGGGEEGLIFYNPLQSLKISQSTWVEINTGLPQLYWLPRIPFLFLTSFLVNSFGLPSYITQAILFFILMAVGMISIYYLTLGLLEKYQSKCLISFIASIYYLFNPFSVSQVWARGLYPQFFAFALLPLSLLLFALSLRQKNYLYIFLMVLSSVIFSETFGIVTYVLTYWVVLLLFLLWWLFLYKFKRDETIFGISFLGILLILWSIANAWWFLPIVIEGSKIFAGYIEGANENLGTLLGVSRNFTPEIIIRLLQRTYYYHASAFSPIFTSWHFQLISWLPVIFVVYGIYKIFRQKMTQFRFFIILLALGLIVSLGANPPFGWLFVWVFKRVSILQAFRNPFEKFGLVYSLGYSAVFAYGLISFFEVKKMKWLGLAVVLFLTCIVFGWPMWTGRVVAGIDRKIGVSVPSSYEELNKWLDVNNREGYRIFMPPLTNGEGSVFDWVYNKYNGVDPMHFILHHSAISNGARLPFYYDFAQNIRKYIGSMDLSNVLQLLRVKYLVNRDDLTSITDKEKDHIKYLTQFIYPPRDEANAKTVCPDLAAESKSNNSAWIICPIPSQDNNWTRVRYLHLNIQTSSAAYIEVALNDTSGIRIRWDGRTDTVYKTTNSEWTIVTIPLSAPTEYNNKIDYSRVLALEVFAHPLSSPQSSVEKISLKHINLDSGKEEKVNTFHLINNFGKLQLYEPVYFNPPPEFGVISSLEKVNNFKELFEKTAQYYESLSKQGFILLSQNKDKNLEDLQNTNFPQILESTKISDTKYFIKLKKEGPAFIILSKNFNFEWKLLSGVTKDQLKGGFLNDLKLFKKPFLSEDNHFAVNGYANLWKVDSKDEQYAVLFMPQIIAELGAQISTLSLVSIFLAWGIIIAVRKIKLWKF